MKVMKEKYGRNIVIVWRDENGRNGIKSDNKSACRTE